MCQPSWCIDCFIPRSTNKVLPRPIICEKPSMARYRHTTSDGTHTPLDRLGQTCWTERSNPQHRGGIQHHQGTRCTWQDDGLWYCFRPRKDTTNHRKMGVYRWTSIALISHDGNVPLAVCLCACCFASLLVLCPSLRDCTSMLPSVVRTPQV